MLAVLNSNLAAAAEHNRSFAIRNAFRSEENPEHRLRYQESGWEVSLFSLNVSLHPRKSDTGTRNTKKILTFDQVIGSFSKAGTWAE